MANQKFCGAVASQAYRYGYTCEYCKQPVEKKNYISTQVGSMHKSTTGSLGRVGLWSPGGRRGRGAHEGRRVPAQDAEMERMRNYDDEAAG